MLFRSGAQPGRTNRWSATVAPGVAGPVTLRRSLHVLARRTVLKRSQWCADAPLILVPPYSRVGRMSPVVEAASQRANGPQHLPVRDQRSSSASPLQWNNDWKECLLTNSSLLCTILIIL